MNPFQKPGFHASWLFLLWFPMLVNAEHWSPKVLLQTDLGRYTDSMVRDSIASSGFILSFDKLGSTEYSFGYQYTTVKTQDNNPDNLDSIEEHRFYLSGKQKIYIDSLPGVTTIRLDGYSAQSKNTVFGTGPASKPHFTTTLTDQLTVINPVISFKNFSQTRFYELGYALSSYRYPDRALADTKVHQFSPAFGFTLGTQYDWIQLRGYFIELDADTGTMDQQNKQALELKWTHWLEPNAPFNLNQLGFQIMTGEYLFAVDPDAAELYNLADTQTQMLAIFGQWRMGDQTAVLAHFSWREFEIAAHSHRYNSSSFYINFSHQW